MALLLVVEKVSLVRLSVRPLEDALSLHFIVSPHSIVLFPVGPDLGAFSLDLALDELSRVRALVRHS